MFKFGITVLASQSYHVIRVGLIGRPAFHHWVHLYIHIQKKLCVVFFLNHKTNHLILRSLLVEADILVKCHDSMIFLLVFDHLDHRFRSFSDGDLMKVVSCMEHAVSAVYPRCRYSPGWDAKFFWLPMSYMPTSVSDKFFLKCYPTPRISKL